MTERFFVPGGQYLRSAVAAEQAQNYNESLKLYIQAFEYILTGLKYCKNNKTRDVVRNHVKEHMVRAEQVKALLAQQQKGNENVRQKGVAPNVASANKGVEKEPKKGAGKHNREPDETLRHALGSTILTEKPQLTWNDVAGLPDAKQALEEAVLLPQKFPQMFTGERKPWKGVLLYGPPGTGKSHIAKVIASISNATFYSVSSADLVSKYFGESEKLIRELFLMASQSKPSIIFIDEIDAICGQRGEGGGSGDEATNRMKTEFLTCMQDVLDDDGVLVLAATNRPFDLDAAVRRRFEKRIYIPLPDNEGRAKLFDIHMGEDRKCLQKDDVEELVERTDGFSGSDISILCRDVLMQPVRECVRSQWWRYEGGFIKPCKPNDEGAFKGNMMDLPPEAVTLPDISMAHFEKSLERAKSSVNQAELEVYDRFTEMFGTVRRKEEEEEEEAEREAALQRSQQPLAEKENSKEKEKEKEKGNDDDDDHGGEPKPKRPRNVFQNARRKKRNSTPKVCVAERGM